MPGRPRVAADPGVPPAGAGRPQRVHQAGTSRYATQVQLSREEKLVATAGRETAPHLTAEQSAELLGTTPEALDAAGRERAQEATEQLPSGVSMGQAAAANAALTSPRVVSSIVGPAGTGKTTTLAEAGRMWKAAGMGPVIGVTVSQAARNVLAGSRADRRIQHRADARPHRGGTRDSRPDPDRARHDGPRSTRPPRSA